MSGKINHIVVLMLENRAFDHFFGFFKPASGQDIENLRSNEAPKTNLLDPSEPESESNPSFQANQPAPFAVHDKEGPSHSFNSVCVQLTNDPGGPSTRSTILNNGFVRSYKDNLLRHTHNIKSDEIAEVMACFSPDQLPAINALAQNFCLCDHWFCEVPGPTMPNRMYIHASTSEGYVHNAFDRPFTSRTIYELIEEKGLTWATYFHDLNEVLQFENLSHTPQHFRRFEDRWAVDIAQGNLPNYSFILPRFNNKRGGKLANSQHAPEDVRFGEHLIADVYDTLAANEDLWNQTVLIVTYDEHGGFYDHVAPPTAPNPDGINSPNPDDHARFRVPAFGFDRLGLRVPAVIASPWIPRGLIESRQLQHTSVIRTAIEIFGLRGSLSHRDASASSFGHLLALETPRSTDEMPRKLPRPLLGQSMESVVAGVVVDPADEPLDTLTTEWIRGFAALVQRKNALSGVAQTEAQSLPATQGTASEFIDQKLKSVYGI